VEAASANIEILGDVYGRGTAGVDIKYVNFTIGLTAGGTPIDLQRMTIVYQNQTGRNEIALATGWYGSSPPAGQWTVFGIYNGDTNSMLERGEQADISVALPAGRYVPPRGQFTVEVQPIEGATLTISRTAPGAVDAVQKLF
jgi:flagellin FlaB